MKSCSSPFASNAQVFAAIISFLGILLLCGVTNVRCEAQTAASCRQAQDDCQISHTCGLHYHSVLIRCRNTYSNDTSCSEECIMAQNSLASGTKEGRRFAQCTCTGGTVEDVQLYCQNLDKVFSCIRSDVITDAVNTTVLCNDARRYCEDDWVCRDALHYYEVACEQSERKNRARPNACPTQRCQDSYEILMRQNHADNLRGCDCAEASLSVSPGWVYCFDVAKLVSCEVATGMPTFVNKASRSCNDNLSVVLLLYTIFVFCSFLYSELFAQQI